MKTRFLLSVLLVLTLCFCLMLASCDNSNTDGKEPPTEYVTNSLVFELDGDGYKVIGYDEITANVVIPSTYKGKAVTSIGNEAFYNCTSLTSVEIPNSVTSIGEYAFCGCASLTSVVIPNSVTSIGERAFYYCTSLTSVVIPNSVTSIGEWAFFFCTGLTIYCEAESQPSGWSSDWNYSGYPVVWNCNNNDVADNGYIYTVIDGIKYGIKDESATVADWPSNIKEAIIKESITYKNKSYIVTSIGEMAFYGCESLTSVSIGDSVTSIGSYAFQYCTSLTSVVIPNSVTSIGYWAFYDCTGLTIYCEDQSKPSGWSSDWNCSDCPVVWNCNNNDVADNGYIYTVIDGIRYGIKDGSATVAEQPSNIKEAIIKESITYKNVSYTVTSIDGSAFYNCTSLTEIIVDKSNTVYASQNGVLYTKDMKTLIQYPAGKKDSTFTIPNSVTNIDGYAFAGCVSLTSAVIPNSVTSIGNYAFRGCTGLTRVVIPNSVTNIGDYAFDNCTSLTSVTIGNSVTSIGYWAFSGCTSLTSVEIPNSVTSIGDAAFYYCSSLTSIEIPNSVTSIGTWAFAVCDSLTIYCEAQSKPSGWDSDWNYSNCPVEWGYKQGN